MLRLTCLVATPPSLTEKRTKRAIGDVRVRAARREDSGGKTAAAAAGGGWRIGGG